MEDIRMILCDIGNSTFHFFYKNQDLSFSLDKTPIMTSMANQTAKCIFYISVNKEAEEKLISKNTCLNLKDYLTLDSNYNMNELGPDRAFACHFIKDGVVVDVGSAITVDIVENSKHLGGYILPGIESINKAFSSISPQLNKPISLIQDFSSFPKTTLNAMSSGVVKSLLLLIQEVSKGKKVYFTGGLGKFFTIYVPNSLYDKHLVFRGMQKVIQEKKLLEEYKK